MKTKLVMFKGPNGEYLGGERRAVRIIWLEVVLGLLIVVGYTAMIVQMVKGY